MTPDQPESSEKAPDTCPHCGSHHPNLHPAMQLGGEVQICGDPWHGSVLKVPNTPEGQIPAAAEDLNDKQRQRDIERLENEDKWRPWLEKLPMLDFLWAEEIQERWWRAFEKIAALHRVAELDKRKAGE